MTPEEKDGVIWWAIDDALKRASSFYESMARSHITDLVNEIKNALDRNGLEITEKAGKPPEQPPSPHSVTFKPSEGT